MKVELTDDMATNFCIGKYRANGRVPKEDCLLSSSDGHWTVSINEHYLLDEPNERYTRIYGSPCFVYKFGTKFYSKDDAIECFNEWLKLGRTPEEEEAALKPEWDEFTRRNQKL